MVEQTKRIHFFSMVEQTKRIHFLWWNKQRGYILYGGPNKEDTFLW